MTSKLGGGRMKPADFDIPRVVAKVPPKTTVEQIMSATYWQNYSNQLQVNSHITVLAEDASLHAELMVSEIDPLRAKMRLLHVHVAPDAEEFDGNADQTVDGMDVSWGGPNHKYRITHGGEVVEKGFHTKESAQERMAELAAG